MNIADLPTTPRVTSALILAARRARGLGNAYIGTEHLLSGIMRCGGGPGALIIQQLLGGTFEQARDAVERAVTEVCGPSHWARLESEVADHARWRAVLLQRKLDILAARMDAAIAAQESKP